MEAKYNKEYWRVDAEYLTIEHVINVSDKAPVGVWIPTIGDPYAYFIEEKDAKGTLKAVLITEIDQLTLKLKTLED